MVLETGSRSLACPHTPYVTQAALELLILFLLLPSGGMTDIKPHPAKLWRWNELLASSLTVILACETWSSSCVCVTHTPMATTACLWGSFVA